MMPHVPYFFNESGKMFNPKVSLTDKQKYLAQLKFTNSLTLKTIIAIFSSTNKNTVIIIQGDHGYRNLNDVSALEKSAEAHSLFYAFYTPSAFNPGDSLKPVNTLNKIIEKINIQPAINQSLNFK